MATYIAPIGIDQINVTLYVTNEGEFTTVQAAVNFAAINLPNRIAQIVVTHGHNIADDIGAVTGGHLSTRIVDQRNEVNQRYEWNGTNYVPQDFTQLGAIIAPYYHFNGSPGSIPPDNSGLLDFESTLHRARLVARSNDFSIGQLEFSGASSSADGRFLTYLVMDEGLAQFGVPVTAPFYGVKAQAQAAQLGDDQGIIDYESVLGRTRVVSKSNGSSLGQIELAGASSSADGRFLTYLVMDEGLAQFGVPVSINGDLEVTGTATVDGSPVQGKLSLTTTGTNGPSTLTGNTLNIPQYAGASGGMVYPDAGIGVSTGIAWETSLDPATLARYPASGIPVSNGTAWATPIDPATVPRLNTVNNFSKSLNVADGIASHGPATGTLALGSATLSYEPSSPTGYARLLAKGAANTAVAPAISLSGLSGDTTNYWEYLRFSSDGTGYVANMVADLTVTAYGPVQGNLTVAGAITGGGFLAIPAINIQRTDSAPSVPAGTAILRTGVSGAPNLVLDAPVGGGIYFNFDQGTGAVNFCNGAGVVTASVTDGHGAFLSLAVSGAKTFAVTHPFDETKDLIHACLEGPENGVYYRGEVVTTDGRAEVTLPDYFEALTFPEDRSVLLTVIVDDDNPVFGGQVAAGRIKDGKFKVYSTDPTATIAWEVKAVRRINVERLQVVTDRYVPPITDDATTMPVTPKATAGKTKAGRNVH